MVLNRLNFLNLCWCFIGFLMVPSLLFANPVTVTIQSAIVPLLLEALFFANILSLFGFRGLLIMVFWAIFTSFTWFSLLSVPMGTFLAMAGGSAALRGVNSFMAFFTMAFIAEVIICLVEAGAIILVGKFRLLRPAALNSQNFNFRRIFLLALVGNLLSVIAGTGIFTSSYVLQACLWLTIIPALFVGRKIAISNAAS